MQYVVQCQATVAATREQVWSVWSDMASYPEWDPREETLRFAGPLEPGSTGYSRQKGGRSGSDFTVVFVDPGRRWTNETPLPAGKLVIDHTIDDTDDGSLLLSKTYTAYGPVALLFRLYYAKEMRRNNPRSFEGLVEEIARRYPTATP
jgi:Polyketide cyclase / dehydrase and lipid transport